MKHPEAVTIHEAVEFSRKRLRRIEGILQTSSVGQKLGAMGVSLAVSGSLGRLESLEASDIDLVTLCPDTISLEVVLLLDQEVRQLLRVDLGIEVSRGENFTGPTFLREVIAPAQIGGSGDNVNLLTKRACILTETRAVLNQEFARLFRQSIATAFLTAPAVRRRHLIPIADEIVRYYRTLCIDYKSRVEHEGKPWAVRYLKLRCSRKYWFFSLVLGITAVLLESEPIDQIAEERLLALLDLTPTERIQQALSVAGLEPHSAIFAYYGRFLRDMASTETRSFLSTVTYEGRHSSPAYVRMKGNADRLHRSMLEIVESLPVAWRRHLFSRFLLHS